MALGRTFSVGIDIGTNQVKVIVAESADSWNARKTEQTGRATDSGTGTGGSGMSGGIQGRHGSQRSTDHLPRVIGGGMAETRGMRHGYITNQKEVVKSIKTAVAQAEKNAGVSIKRAYVSINGVGLGAIISSASVNTTKADAEITDLDVKRAIEESEKELPNQYIQNRKIVHTIPLEFKIDGKKVLGKPQGLKGLRLEARVLYMTCLAHHLNDILSACEEADIEIQDVIAGPMASSFVTLSKTQKIAGCLLANIGCETTSIIVFENNIPISLEVFPFGSNDITNDIALGLKVSLEDAETIKIGNGKPSDHSFSKKKLDEIIIARLADIFDLINDHLKRIDRSGLLPAGVILTGGGAILNNIEEFAKIALHLPAKKSNLDLQGNLKVVQQDQEWAVAYGLAMVGLGTDDGGLVHSGSTAGIIGKLLKRFWSWLKQFLP
jgi:cell division protein FtsA